MWELKLFGRFQLKGPVGPVELASVKLRALLAYLAVLGPRGDTRERVTCLLWGSHFEEQARQNFRQALTRLRKIIGSGAILLEDQLVMLSPGSISTDVARFEALVRARSEEDLQQAVGLAEGAFMSGMDVQEAAWEEWVSSERRRLAAMAADALVSLGEMEFVHGDMTSALGRGEAVIGNDFWREDAHRLVMRSLAKLGRRTEALKHFQAFSDRLKNELDTAPETATTQCCEALRRDTSLPGKTPLDQDAGPVPPLYPDKPSIAVLPFANLSGDPQQEYFADGMVEEIITALSRFHWLFVIARNSSFTYKNRPVDVKQVGLELRVRYVLEGSVRKSAGRVRITGQLIDTSSGAHLWAERFEGMLEDIFDLQDQVTADVVGAIAPKLEQAEIERIKHKPTESLDAYDHYLRGMACVHQWTKEANEQALSHFYRAIELDADFGAAYGMAARCYSQRRTGGWVTDRETEVAETKHLARQAVEHGWDDAVALCSAGISLFFVVGESGDGVALIDRALVLNPNLAAAWLFRAWVRVWLGKSEAAIEDASQAMRLSPNDPQAFRMQAAIASAHFFAGDYREALAWAETALRFKPNDALATTVVAASNALLDQLDEARRAMAHLREIDPALRISNLRDQLPINRPEHLARWAQGLRKAGLPD